MCLLRDITRSHICPAREKALCVPMNSHSYTFQLLQVMKQHHYLCGAISATWVNLFHTVYTVAYTDHWRSAWPLQISDRGTMHGVRFGSDLILTCSVIMHKKGNYNLTRSY